MLAHHRVTKKNSSVKQYVSLSAKWPNLILPVQYGYGVQEESETGDDTLNCELSSRLKRLTLYFEKFSDWL
jgi:hypothetical protein